ncbi:MAG: type II toxin-antitoxin system Phd/YefM family antitoxin [Caldilineaceae bacterium]|nr:type II toxin-antitoxin system Phd/YefM family antitoxin [Caldilineaceae bacterium]
MARTATQHRLGATELRNQLGKLLNRVQARKEHLLIEKLGIPVAAVISMEEYEEYQRLTGVNPPLADETNLYPLRGSANVELDPSAPAVNPDEWDAARGALIDDRP